MPRTVILSNPRSGSTFFQELLTSHPEVEIEEELLNDEHGQLENPLEHVKTALDKLSSTYVGFKVFPEQIYGCQLSFGDLMETIGATHVIVLYREGILESLVSRRIADLTGEWYSTTKTSKTRQIEIDADDLQDYTTRLTSEWERVGSEWPVDIRPIFVKFEDLQKNPIGEVKRALAEMSLSTDEVVFRSPAERQNPSPVQKKVINYDQLPKDLREGKLDVKKILLEKINVSLEIPKELLQFAPDREPCMPPGGWRYRVAEPYLPNIAKQNAFDAIQSGSISSAGFWPREMAKKLRSLFQCPVAQPCSNGFTALLLAMQAANIGEGDEVIVPTMTMVAVPNAVYYLRATPVFADNAKDSYNPSWVEYESLATAKTKAIVVTHTYGVPVEDIEAIASQCKARGWVLIEDISECVGITCLTTSGEERLLGTFGDFTIASLYANKIIQGGDGGFVLAKEAKIGKRLTSIVNHGFTPSFHFVHFEQAPNAKIHGIGAAIASGCLDEVENIMEHRSLLSKLYRKHLSGTPLKLMPKCGARDTPWVFGLQCQSKSERTKLRAFLATYGIETRDFFFNLHLQPAYLKKGSSENGLIKPSSLPNAEILGSSGFYLPTHSNLWEEDVIYICEAVKLYFSPNQISQVSLTPVKKPPKQALQVRLDAFVCEVRRYRESGELVRSTTRDHIYLEAVKLGHAIDETLFHERYDQVQIVLRDINKVLKEVEGDPMEKKMKKYFKTFLQYYEAHIPLEQPCGRPWLTVNLKKDDYSHSRKIPTTTDPETLQLLIYLLEQNKPETIWEIGCWMGHATTLMSEVCTRLNFKHRVFACDAFKYQAWMRFYLPEETSVLEGKSFLDVFQKNLGPYAQNVEAVDWPYDIGELPVVLKNQKPSLVFLDITQEDEDLEHIWSLIQSNLIPNETIILLNGVVSTSIPFLTRHAINLKAIAKPNTMAKAFLYVKPEEIPKSIPEGEPEDDYEKVQEMMRRVLPLPRSLKFYSSPSWDHHHRNLYCKSIDLLKSRLHSDDADVLFIPAVEETLCDDPDIFYQNPWIGIIHSVEHHPELFYTPDLSRLCTRASCIAALKNCRGLFTLTQFQSNYLRTNLPKNVPKFPIQSLTYPTEIIEDGGPSQVPDLLKKGEKVDLLHIGSFARNYSFFFDAQVPSEFRKVLVAGDDETQEVAKSAPKDVIVTGRLSGVEYEERLKFSVVFLTLKYEGAANTLILECISRNVPILSPKISSCIEYIGKDYPLSYDPLNPEFGKLLTLENIQRAIDYLKAMDKSKFSREKFVRDVAKGAVMLSLPPKSLEVEHEGKISEGQRKLLKYDVTICICSYKRTHHLPKLLESLWNKQDFKGSFQIVIWNNNEARLGIVRELTSKYIENSTDSKSLELISSTENYYCSIRFALPALMRSECLLICDDDIIPGGNFISFFHSAHQKHPKDVLCVRGHEFLPHKLDAEDPLKVWMEYDSLRFRNDDEPEQSIHFVHADACLIPKAALQEIASVPMPDPTFALVDDYWMSYILSHRFERNLRKLCVAGLPENPIVRTDDSDKPGLALHTRPEVQDARLRLYVHHMVNGWPSWKTTERDDYLKSVGEKKKKKFWDLPPQIGFNISSSVTKEDIVALVKTGTKCVRIGAVGVGGKEHFELSGFLKEPEEQLERLTEVVKNLKEAGVDVIITLERRLASEEVWQLIAKRMAPFENVVGYDLINEPFTEVEKEMHWLEIGEAHEDKSLEKLENKLQKLIESIREVDHFTPIVLEPSYWGRIYGLSKFPIEKFLKIDSNIIFSLHFYEPMILTSRMRNKRRYSFPCSIPHYDGVAYSEETYWNEEEIFKSLEGAKKWADSNGVRIFVGEFGVCRDVGGAAHYLKAVIGACKALSMTGLLFSFRDPDWEAMDYEFGPVYESFRRDDDNELMKVVLEGVRN